jgi:hypothetical protein
MTGKREKCRAPTTTRQLGSLIAYNLSSTRSDHGGDNTWPTHRNMT